MRLPSAGRPMTDPSHTSSAHDPTELRSRPESIRGDRWGEPAVVLPGLYGSLGQREGTVTSQAEW